MTINFHPLTLGVMLIVAVGTVAYTLWTSKRTEQSHHRNNQKKIDFYAKYKNRDDEAVGSG